MSKFSMHRVKLAELTKPRTGLARVYVDHWWPVSGDEELYFFGSDRHPMGSPQCNPDEHLARAISERLTNSPDGRMQYENYQEIRQIPAVFIPTHMSEYVD